MTRFRKGDDVIVEFQGVECAGEVISQSIVTGYVMARILVDVEVDWGSISPRMDPRPTVCVPDSCVRSNRLP